MPFGTLQRAGREGSFHCSSTQCMDIDSDMVEYFLDQSRIICIIWLCASYFTDRYKSRGRVQISTYTCTVLFIKDNNIIMFITIL